MNSGHVEQIPGAQPEEPQPRPQGPFLVQPAAQHPAAEPEPRRSPTAAVIAAACISIVVGVTVVAAFSGGGRLLDRGIISYFIPAVLVTGGITAVRGRRGWLTAGAALLALTGVALVVMILVGNNYPNIAWGEAAIRVVAATLILVLSRLPRQRSSSNSVT